MSVIRKIRRMVADYHLSLKVKLALALSTIGLTLLVSSIISVMEYRSMSTYVSTLIADDIRSINVARELLEASDTYNLGILSVIGDEEVKNLPYFDQQGFVSQCDSLKTNFAGLSQTTLADSVLYSYSAYMLTSLEFEGVVMSDFVDTRSWYFERLQPRYNRLKSDIDAMSTAIYRDLEKNSASFERGFYRSIIPGIAAVAVGLLLVIMLGFFLLSYYVVPVYKMLESFQLYRQFGKKYTYDFDGDDQLHELNDNIRELADDNQQLRHRISSLRRQRRV